MPIKQAKLLYIISLGHSGSTLLDLLCGTLPGVFSMGEMHFLSWQLKQGEIKDDPQSYCSCGSYFDECKFWSPILKDISQKKDNDIFKNPEGINFSINRGIVRDKKSLKHTIINKLFQLSFAKAIFKPFRFFAFNYYKKSIKDTWQLYDMIARKSNSEYVVDSSKNTNRAFLLKMFRPKHVKLLILRRDIKGVASSSHYGLNDAMIKERVMKWLKFHNKKLPLYLSHISPEDYMEVTYEGLCSSYNTLRNDIAKFTGLQPEELSPIKYISPSSYHTVQGNPIRLSKKDIVIKHDERWKERLNEKQLEWIKKHT